MKNQKHIPKNAKILIFLSLCFLFLVFGFWFSPSAEAAFFSLDPKTYTASAEATFDVEIKIDTEGEQTTSADAVLIFDQNILEVVDTTPGDFYPQNFKSISPGKAYIGGAVENATEYKTGVGLLSTITFKGKAGGTTIVRFDCTPGKTSDSNISKNDTEATDILDCTKLVNGTYTITGSPRPTFAPVCSGDITANCKGGQIINVTGAYDSLNLTGMVGNVTVVNTNQTSWTWSNTHYQQYFRNQQSEVNFTLKFYQEGKVINTITKTVKIGPCETPEAGVISPSIFLLGLGGLLTILGFLFRL